EELFSNNKNNIRSKDIKIKLPLIDFLKKPEKQTSKKEDIKIDAESLEKILLDFGVEGKIKKISNGPVVSLNEFEPAAGVKVSKIVNLSEDIARNTSSESARIATIPGSNTVGIELPKNIKGKCIFKRNNIR
ncbi:DNA translocase FtsK, partial [Candidatus Pelagibacter sp.]|nr:DNA translocase FtsK [Candidatus Pelagibacter sp.]